MSRDDGEQIAWPYTLASTRPATGTNHRLPEPFLDTLRRALDEYAFIMDPKNGHLMKHLHNGTFVERAPDPHWGAALEKSQGDDVHVTAYDSRTRLARVLFSYAPGEPSERLRC